MISALCRTAHSKKPGDYGCSLCPANYSDAKSLSHHMKQVKGEGERGRKERWEGAGSRKGAGREGAGGSRE